MRQDNPYGTPANHPFRRSVKISLVIPTFNERRNIEPLLEELFEGLRTRPDIDLEVVFVDDNSSDGTQAEISRLTGRYPISLLRRTGKYGLGSAVIEGFRESQRPIVGVMDGDLSHDPRILVDMIDSMSEVDIAIGSRFESGSKVEQWTFGRKWLSMIGVVLARRLTHVSDPLSGYFLVRREKVAPLLTKQLVSPGYKLLLEILCRCQYRSVRSFSYVFRQRTHSASKLNLREYLLFMKQLFHFTVSGPPASTQVQHPTGHPIDSFQSPSFKENTQ